MINSFHCFFECKVHHQNNKCDDCRCNCNNDGTALEFTPTWPAHFVKKLIGRLINIGLEFTHIRYMLFVRTFQFSQTEPLAIVIFYAQVERFELPSKVLETSILPLNYTCLIIKDILIQHPKHMVSITRLLVENSRQCFPLPTVILNVFYLLFNDLSNLAGTYSSTTFTDRKT